MCCGPGRVGEEFRQCFSGCSSATVCSGCQRWWQSIFFTGISGSHRAAFLLWYRQRKQRSRVVYLLRSVQWLPAADCDPSRFRKRSCFCCVAVVSGVCTCSVCVEVFTVASGRHRVFSVPVSSETQYSQWFIRDNVSAVVTDCRDAPGGIVIFICLVFCIVGWVS